MLLETQSSVEGSVINSITANAHMEYYTNSLKYVLMEGALCEIRNAENIKNKNMMMDILSKVYNKNQVAAPPAQCV